MVAGESSTLTVPDPGTGISVPYGLNPSSRALIESLRLGEMNIEDLDVITREMLLLTQTLCREKQQRREMEQWQRRCQDGRAQLASVQHSVLPDLLPVLMLAALRRYVRGLRLDGYLTYDEDEHRLSSHNDPVLRYVHHQLLSVVHRILPERVRPSYCYLGAYMPGAELRAHRDRPQCAWNLSLLIDTEPDMGREDAWPIFLQTDEGAAEVRLAMGDGVLFSGTDTLHWRPPLATDHVISVVFFHFVPSDFEGDLD